MIIGLGTIQASLFSFAKLEKPPEIISPKAINSAEKKYGKLAKNRMNEWQKLVNKAYRRPEKVKLKMVNDFFNDVRYKTDIKHWKKKDYWATPIEFLGTDAGDCEDYVIAKYFTLKAIGVPEEKLYLNYVKLKDKKRNQAHMVLTYFKTPKSIPVVLDNFNKKIVKATKRKDLVPIYSFNGDGLWLAKQRGKGQPVKGGTSKLEKWNSLLKKMENT